MVFMYQNLIAGISRVDTYNLSLDIYAFDMVGIRYIVVVKFLVSEPKSTSVF